MRLILLLAVMTIGLRAVAAGEERGDGRAGPGADASNAFALKLYERVAGGGAGNVFFSPASLSVALAMTDLGARGETRKQIEAVLGFDGADPAKVQDAYAALHRRTQQAGGGGDVQLKVANRLWPQKRFTLLPAFTGDAKERYDAVPEALDYAADLDGSRQAINRWVERQTADKIKELIKPGVLPPDTRLVLTNAIYFKGDWTDKFNKAATKDEPFHPSADRKVDVPMMRRTGAYRYSEDEAAQWLELPYGKGELAMVVVLPRKLDGLAGVTKGLDGKALSQKIGGMQRRESVQVWLPKFKMTAAFELSGVLSEMGMPLAFGDKADFSGMTIEEALMISKVVHQAYVDVNEEGTEAAAATAVVMKPKMARPPAAPVEFKADRPFLFLIRDTKSGAILFLGRTSNPKGA